MLVNLNEAHITVTSDFIPPNLWPLTVWTWTWWQATRTGVQDQNQGRSQATRMHCGRMG